MNCGLGPTDLARLHTAALDLKRGWLDCPRSKTAADRRAKHWPETVAALRVAIAERPDPKNPEDSALLFVTRLGNPWVQTKPAKAGSVSRMATTDSVGLEFRKLLKSLKVPSRGFYHLRHVFRTIGDEVRDTPASIWQWGTLTAQWAGTIAKRSLTNDLKGSPRTFVAGSGHRSRSGRRPRRCPAGIRSPGRSPDRNSPLSNTDRPTWRIDLPPT